MARVATRDTAEQPTMKPAWLKNLHGLCVHACVLCQKQSNIIDRDHTVWYRAAQLGQAGSPAESACSFPAADAAAAAFAAAAAADACWRPRINATIAPAAAMPALAAPVESRPAASAAAVACCCRLLSNALSF